MANSINEAVKGFQKEIGVIIADLVKVKDEVSAISKEAVALATALGKVRTPDGARKTSKESRENTEKLNKAISEQEKLERRLLSTIAKLQLVQSKEANTLAKKNEELKILRRIQRNEVKQVSELTNAYEKLAAQNNLLIREYQDLATKQKQGIKLTDDQVKAMTQLSDRINKNQKVLKETDAEVGRFTRNVGNYSSGFNGLANSINQLTREAPAFANSLQTGFLAISNNFGALSDEISKLIKQNQVLVSQGEKPISIFKRLSSAIFSLQTLLSVGVTLLTIYGKQLTEFIIKVAQGGIKVRELSKQQKILNKAYKDGAKAASQEIAQLTLLIRFAGDKTKADDKRNKAVTKLIKSSNGLITEQDRLNILNGKALEIENKLVKAILRKAIVQQLTTKIAEDINKLLDNQIEIRKREAENQREIEKLRKLGLISSKDEIKATEELNKKIKARNELRKKSTLRSRDFVAASTKATSSIDKASKNVDKNKKATEENAIIQENINNLIKEALKLTDGYTLSLDNNTKAVKRRNRVTAQELKTAEEYAEEAKKLSKLFGDLFKEQLLFKAPEIDQDSLDLLQDQLDKAIVADILNEDVQEKFKQNFAALFKSIEDVAGVNANVLDDFFTKITERGTKSFEDIANIAQASFDVIGEAGNALFQGSIRRYDEEIEANNAFYANLLENELLSDEERRKLEADRKGKEKQLKKEQDDERRKAFRFNQILAIAEIAVNLAKTISAINLAAAAQDAITPFAFGATGIAYRAANLPLAIGSAALQTGVVLSKSVPKFKDGHLAGTYEGIAMVNDAKGSNFREVIERKDGSLEMFQERNQLIKMDRGDKVHAAGTYLDSLSDEELMKNVQKHSFIANMQHYSYLASRAESNRLIKSDKQNTDRIVRAIQKSKPNIKVVNNNKVPSSAYLRALNEEF